MSGIPEGAQHAGGMVIKHRQGNACKNNLDIRSSHWQDILRCPNQCQQRHGHSKSRCRKDDADNGRHPQAVPVKTVHLIPVFCTEGLGERNTEAGCTALYKAEN